VSETWYTNGQVEVREHFKDGVSHGLREKWYENGTRLSLAMIADAKVIGTFRSWHDNGQLSEQIEMKLGLPDGVALAYYPSGFLKAETTVHEGQVLERKLWNDGDRKNIP
jgi:antitoxin component YwqK of YwqJK toxin-antitoxin module